MDANLVKKYIGIYLGILGCFLLLMIPIYITAYNGTEKLILTERYNNLKQESIYLDDQIGKLFNITELLGNNANVNKLASISGEPASWYSLDMLKVRDFLNSCFNLSGENFDEYLIFRDNPIIIDSGKIMSSISKQDYEAYERNGMSFEEFQQMVFSNELSPQYIAETEEDREGGIICIQKVPVGSRFWCDTAMVFTLDRDVLNNIFGIEEENRTDFAYIEDKFGNIVYKMNFQASALTKEEIENKEIKLNGQKYTVFQMETSNSGLHLVLGISQATIKAGITDVNRVITIYISIAVLGMIVFCVFWARSRARNMENMLMEMETLKGSISESILEKLLLHGVYTAKEKEEVGRYLRWNMEYYCVVCVSTRLEKEEKILETFCRTDEFIRNSFTCIVSNTGQNERNYIIQVQNEWLPDVSAILDRLKILVEEQLDVYIGVSAVGTGLENIQLCYRQAGLMSRQASDQYDSQLKAYQKPDDIGEKIFKLNLGNRIYDLIAAEEKETLHELFCKIRSYALRASWYTEAEIMQFFFEVQNPIARIWDEVEQGEREKTILAYQTKKPIVELIDSLEETSCYLCDCIGRNKENNKNAFGHKMLQFVEDNYTNKDMCVSFVAGYLGISDKYFTALFKEQIGKNFGAYVETMRMKKAEHYLLETDFSVAKIAELVGYNTLDAFYKSFKKIYGLAPGKWKECNKK